MTSPEDSFFKQHQFLVQLIAGGCCGLAVDSFLFPIDTCKTRLQSESGFWKSGGFRGIYNGVVPVISASVPIASLFFCVYHAAKTGVPLFINLLISDSFIYNADDGYYNSTAKSIAVGFFINFLINSFAASLGEMCASLIRVPIEIVKQNRQVSKVQYRAVDILLQLYRSDGLVNGVYRGYGITIMRDIPFSMIQYPLWELLSSLTTPHIHDKNWKIIASSVNGSFAGAAASGITTPLDVAKTRIQLAEIEDGGSPPGDGAGGSSQNPFRVLRLIYRQKGITGIFSGFVPRVMWMWIGGFIWFGTYSLVKYILENI